MNENEIKYKGQGAVGANGQGDPSMSDYSAGETNPQNFYRSYGGNGKPFTGSRDAATTTTEKVSHEAMIARANGGQVGFAPMQGDENKEFEADGK